MKKQFLVFTICLAFLTGCSGGVDFSDFPTKATLKMTTDDYSAVSGKKTTFRDYLTPFAKIERTGKTVLFGFIFHEIDWIDGVAYLVDHGGNVQDTLVVTGIDPPNQLWVEVGDKFLLLEDGGMIEEGPLPPGRTDSYWVDTLEYRIGEKSFELVLN